MSSYGSFASKRLNQRRRDTNSDLADENTPLLTVPDNSLFPGSGGFSISTPPLGPQRDDTLLPITHVSENGDILDTLPILAKSFSNTPLGIEVEAIPATADQSGINNDFRLPRDDTLRYIPSNVADNDGPDDEFHGGITTKKFWLIFTGILIANFIAAFDGTIMASTHTSITSDFHASELAAWLSTSFLLTSTSFQPLYGRVSDVVGRKIPFVFSCLIFTTATMWCALAPNLLSFIIARSICGIGAGGMVTMGAVVLSDIVPIETRGFYQSVNNLGWGLGGVLGAACGGYIADTVGWRWEFGLQVPFGIFCIIVLMCTIPDPEKIETAGLRERFKDFDFTGSVYLTSSLMFLILGLNLGGNVLPWGDYRILGSLAIGAILGALLLRAEQRAISPVMPLRLLWSAPRGLLIFNNVANMIIVNSVLFNLPLYFQAVRGESAAEAGGRLFIPSIAGTFAGVSTGLIITRTGRLHDTLYFGAILLIIGCGMFCVMPPNLPFWGYFIFLIPVNLGSGFVMPSSLLSILATSSQEEQAVATSTLIMWRSLGGVLGVALSSLIVQNGLNTFLERDITGPNKQEIIDMVRKSVNSIYGLDPIHKAEVALSYESSLKLCFVFTTAVSVVAALLVYRIQLPNIRRKMASKKMEFVHGGE